MCLIALYWSVILALVGTWDIYDFPGFIVPLLSSYIIWRRKYRLWDTRRTPTIWGFFVLLASGILLFLGKVSVVIFICYISFIATLIGLVLYILGWEHFKLLSFPMLFLFLMIPIPLDFLGSVTYKLQLISARFGALCLELIKVPVVLERNIIHLPETTLVVAETCAGMRYVFTTMILAILLIYLTQKTWLARILYMVIAVLIAVTTNVLRVAGAGALAHFISVKMISGFYHNLHGWSMFLFSYGALIGTAILLSRVFKGKGKVTG